ncbi:MAG: DUF1289 domain-containing protein [Alphaproteobacteria bacterium]|nr:DUF1289 domain-containing protein [Alphaproteobacteria bacterium]MDA8010491.1 DUF1289 domain-containing protein [Alphaproteobacteria bacterium]
MSETGGRDVSGSAAVSGSLGGRRTGVVVDDGSQALEARARRLARRSAKLARGEAPWQRAGPASPCVKVCRFADHGRWCAGCYRTAGEIRDWPILGPGEREEILRAVAGRRLEED